MSGAFALAFTAALNPTLLTATLVMLFATEPRRLMSGFLLGAYAISISLGLVIVFALQDSGAVSTTQHAISPAVDVALGLLLLLVAFLIRSDRDAKVQERRRRRADAKAPKEAPRWRKTLDQGSARSAFAVGVLLTLPGASYLAGMSRIGKQNVSTLETVLAVVGFCVVMLLLIEIPLLGFAISPDRTRRTIKRFTDWVSTNTRTIVTRVTLVLGSLLLLHAAITVLS
jgi:Sap-like sulfolipid-1-addressing protein